MGFRDDLCLKNKERIQSGSNFFQFKAQKQSMSSCKNKFSFVIRNARARKERFRMIYSFVYIMDTIFKCHVLPKLIE